MVESGGMRLRRASSHHTPPPAAWARVPDTDEVVVIKAARASELAQQSADRQVEAA